MQLRRFNVAGLDRFKAFLAAARVDGAANVPWEVLEDDVLTEPMDALVQLDRPGFRTKREMVTYLRDRLQVLPERGLMRDAGLWTWLAMFYFDDLCPVQDGKRKVLSDWYYIYMVDQMLYWYRHLIVNPYEIYSRAQGFDEAFLTGPPSVLGGFSENTMRSLYVTRIDCIWEVMQRLYFDPRRGTVKPGVAKTSGSPKAGDLSRLGRRIRQLEKTYDLQSLNADRFLALLGDEFKPWLADRPLSAAEA